MMNNNNNNSSNSGQHSMNASSPQHPLSSSNSSQPSFLASPHIPKVSSIEDMLEMDASKIGVGNLLGTGISVNNSMISSLTNFPTNQDGLDLELFDIFQLASGIDGDDGRRFFNQSLPSLSQSNDHSNPHSNDPNMPNNNIHQQQPISPRQSLHNTAQNAQSSNNNNNNNNNNLLNSMHLTGMNSGGNLNLAQQQLQLLQREQLLRQQQQLLLQQQFNRTTSSSNNNANSLSFSSSNSSTLLNNLPMLNNYNSISPTLSSNNLNMLNGLSPHHAPVASQGHNSSSSSSSSTFNNPTEYTNAMLHSGLSRSNSANDMTSTGSISNPVDTSEQYGVSTRGASGRLTRMKTEEGTSSHSPQLTPSSAHYNSPYYHTKQSKSHHSHSHSTHSHHHSSQSHLSSHSPPDDDDLDRPDSPNDSSKPEEHLEKGAKRLARKAELARASRRRKKLYVQDLENKVKKLGAKIEELQSKAAQTKSKRLPADLSREEKDRKANQKAIRTQLTDLVTRGSSLDGMGMIELSDLVRKFVLNSRERQSNVEFHLDRVADCLQPGLQVKFALWGLDQNDDFYEKAGLWTSLMHGEVGLSSTQMAAILSKRQAIHQERRNLANCESMLKQVREAVSTHLRSLHMHMDDIQTVMTPVQLAKFYLWVEQNEWCMQMLSTVFQNVPNNSTSPQASTSSSSSSSAHHQHLPNSSSSNSLHLHSSNSRNDLTLLNHHTDDHSQSNNPLDHNDTPYP